MSLKLPVYLEKSQTPCNLSGIMAHFIDKKCIRCDACVEECPTFSILAAEPHYLIDSDTCTDCMDCVSVCPVDAIHKLISRK